MIAQSWVLFGDELSITLMKFSGNNYNSNSLTIQGTKNYKLFA